MSRYATIGWIVDAQYDFMRPDGRLYVKDLGDPDDPGADRILEEVVEAVEWMEEHCDLLVYTGDWHAREDAEIDEDSPNPDEGTYPPHCMGRSDDPEERRGAEIIPEIAPQSPVVLEIDATPDDARRAARVAVESGRPVVIHKVRFNVFVGNPATEVFLEGLEEAFGRPLDFVVAGVARDVCVTQAVDGLRERNHPVMALRDATWGLGLEEETETLQRWQSRGVRVVEVAELERETAS